MSIHTLDNPDQLKPSVTAASPVKSSQPISTGRSPSCENDALTHRSSVMAASGLNFKRKGLLAILERLHQGYKLRVVVAYRDRLGRFGTELIETLLERNGGELLVFNQRDLSPEEELTTDLLAILTVFGDRVNGLQRYHEEVKEDTALPGRWTEG